MLYVQFCTPKLHTTPPNAQFSQSKQLLINKFLCNKLFSAQCAIFKKCKLKSGLPGNVVFCTPHYSMRNNLDLIDWQSIKKCATYYFQCSVQSLKLTILIRILERGSFCTFHTKMRNNLDLIDWLSIKKCATKYFCLGCNSFKNKVWI